jgi:integrase
VPPSLGKRPIADIRRRDLLALRDAVCDRGHIAAANKLISTLKQVFAWAVEREYIDHSPAAGIRRMRETPRSRVLTDEELRAIWQAAPEMGWPFAPYIQFLMLTAARRDEVAYLRWAELSLDMTTWSLPPERTKTAAGRTILLPEAATAILRDLPRVNNGLWVFSTNGRNPITSYANIKLRIDKLSGTSGWVFDDFRRTASTWLAKQGFPPHVGEAHARQGHCGGVQRP